MTGPRQDRRTLLVGLAIFMFLFGGGIPAALEAQDARKEALSEAMRIKDDWLKERLLRLRTPGPSKEGLWVLANNDPVIRNRRGGEPLRIAGREYARGLYCHAVSKILVRLPAPGKAFTAVAGLDDNPDTRRGRGSVVFSVTVDGKESFKSPVMRVGMPGVPVSVDLGGAASFMLEIGDAGDGIGWDQSDWADAKVVLRDGGELWLGDMPLNGPGASPPLPFSFRYGDVEASKLLPDWPVTCESREMDGNRTAWTFAWTDPGSKLQVRCEAVDYRDYPTIEWTLHFKNTGSSDTPLLSSIQALDAAFPRGDLGAHLLRHWEGGYAGPHAYRPHQTALLKENQHLAFTPGGRGSDRVLPFFNLEYGRGGAIIAVGWPGQWKMEFRDAGGGALRVTGGQETTRFLLHPGEEVRSPLIVLQFWAGGDWIDAQNVWRRWMLAHNLPARDGKPLPPQLAGCSSHLFNEMLNANEENQIFFVDRHVSEGLKIDYWWMDAGWYPNNGGWWNTGTWEVDTKRFPRGLRAITDFAHQKGVRIIVWFEPERVTAGTWLWEKHPEWLLGRDPNCRLLNMGNPETTRWLVDHIDRFLTAQGVDLYRQDFNINPLGIWREHDSPDRQGITEIRYNEGYLAYWDELRRRRPALVIDSCSSGGRRNDLETLRRAVPLLRSDDIGLPLDEQAHTYGFASWVPCWGTGTGTDPYGFRSCMGWHMTIGPDARKKDENYEQAVRMVGQWREVADCFLGDYYPLTPYSLSEHEWMAWQFDRPEEGRGMVQAFRRARCDAPERRFRLRGLDGDAAYEFRDLDTDRRETFSGHDLMRKGLAVRLAGPRQAALIAYRKIPK